MKFILVSLMVVSSVFAQEQNMGQPDQKSQQKMRESFAICQQQVGVSRGQKMTPEQKKEFKACLKTRKVKTLGQ